MSLPINDLSYLKQYKSLLTLKPNFITFPALELDDLHLKNEDLPASLDKHHSDRLKKAADQKQALTENMREAAHSIYEEYLSEKANPRLKIDETVVKRLLFKIRSEPPDADWFDESQVRYRSRFFVRCFFSIFNTSFSKNVHSILVNKLVLINQFQ